MAEREAAIKLTLDDGQYVAAMGKAGDAAVRNAQRSERAMQVFGAGVQKATSNLKAMGSTARSSLALVGGLLGGLSFGNALRGAVALDAKMKTLAFRVQVATREVMRATDLQRLFEHAAARTGRTTEEMADAFDAVFSATKDLPFASATLETIGTTAMATGQSIADVATVTQQLQRKFGISADRIGDALAQVFEGAQQGGPAFADFAAVLDRAGAALLQAGIRGERGLGFLIGALNKADAESGGLQKQVGGLEQMLTKLGSANVLKGMAKNAWIDSRKLLNEPDALARLRAFLAKGKRGIDTLKATFVGPDEASAFRILFLDPFEAALKEAKGKGLKGQKATDAALAELDRGLAEFGKGTQTAATMQTQAADRMRDPQARLNAALDQLQRAFSEPQIIAAIEDLSKYLPKIADVFGKFAKFALKNPVLTGALVVGGQAGMGFFQGIMSQAITEAFTGGGGRGGGGGGGGRTGGGIGGARGIRLERHHQMLGEGLTEAQLLGNTLEDEIERGGKRGASKLATALRLAAVGAAAAFVYELGKEQIDNAAEGKSEAIGNAAVVGARTASMRGGIEKQRADAAELRAAIAKLRDEQGGWFSALFGSMAHGAGAEVDAMGNPIGTVDATRSGEPDLEGTMQKQMAELEAQLAQKEAMIAELERGGPAGAPGVPGKSADGRVTGKAVAEALKSGNPLKVEVTNLPSPSGAPAGKAGPGGSRGPKRPAAMAPGGGY